MAVLNVLDCLCHNVRKTSRLLTQFYDDALRPSGIRITQFTLLFAVDQFGETTYLPLAEMLGMDRTTLSRNIELLQREGFVTVASGLTDKRQQVVSLTPLGKEVLTKAMPLWRTAQRKALKRLVSGDQSRLLHDLAELGQLHQPS